MGFGKALGSIGKGLGSIFTGPKPPDSPDFQRQAEMQQASDTASNRQTTKANRADLYGPGYSQTWAQDPNDPDKWTGTYALSPEGQKAFESGERFRTGMSGLGEKALGPVSGLLGSQVPQYQAPGGDVPTYSPTSRRTPQFGGAREALPQYQGPGGAMPRYQGPEGDMPTYGAHRQGVVDAMMSRVNTDIGREKDATRSQLIARGIPEGSEAFNRAMEMSDRKQTDARQQAEISAEQMAGMGYSSALAGRGLQGRESMADFQTGMQGREQGFKEGEAQFENDLMRQAQGFGQDYQGFLASMASHGIDENRASNIYNNAMRSRGMRSQEAGQLYGAQMQSRQQPFNELGALQSGQQMGSPQFQNYGMQGHVGGIDYTGAGTRQGQYDLGTHNAKSGWLGGLGGGIAGLGAAGIKAGLFS